MSNHVLIIDSGSGNVKAGLAGDEAPSVIIRNVIGKTERGLLDKEIFVGREALALDKHLTLSWPMVHGSILDFDGMVKVWAHIFDNALEQDPSVSTVLLTDNGLSLKGRQQMASIFFDFFQVPALYVSNRNILALYARGWTTGFVLHSGAGITTTTAIFEGYTISSPVPPTKIGGNDVTAALTKLLEKTGVYDLNREIVENIKAKLCYIALDYAEELQKWELHPEEIESEYQLPTGEFIRIGKERFEAPEILFSPIAGSRSDFTGIARLVSNSIGMLDPDIRGTMAEKILLTGGNTLLPNFNARLQKEVAGSFSPSARVNVDSPSERFVSGWIGGSILASLSTFQELKVTREQYNDTGPSVVPNDGQIRFI